MLVNYIMQAVLTTFFFAILVPSRLNKISEEVKNYRPYARIIDAIHHSSRTFLDAAMMFCLAMLIAAMVTFARTVHNGLKAPLTTYTSITSAFMALYSVLPAVLLHACISNQLRRAKWRRASWVITVLLGLAVMGLFLAAPDMFVRYQSTSNVEALVQSLHDPDHQFAWDAWCLNHVAARNFLKYAWFLNALLLVFCILYLTLLWNLRFDKAPRDWIRRLRDRW